MFKLLLGIVGLIETLYPEQFIKTLTKYSYDYEGEAPTAKPWVISAARLEGLVILGAVVYAALKADCSCSILCRTEETEDSLETDKKNETESVDRID